MCMSFVGTGWFLSARTHSLRAVRSMSNVYLVFVGEGVRTHTWRSVVGKRKLRGKGGMDERVGVASAKEQV